MISRIAFTGGAQSPAVVLPPGAVPHGAGVSASGAGDGSITIQVSNDGTNWRAARGLTTALSIDKTSNYVIGGNFTQWRLSISGWTAGENVVEINMERP